MSSDELLVHRYTVPAVIKIARLENYRLLRKLFLGLTALGALLLALLFRLREARVGRWASPVDPGQIDRAWLEKNLQYATPMREPLADELAGDWEARLRWHRKLNEGGWVAINWP